MKQKNNLAMVCIGLLCLLSVTPAHPQPQPWSPYLVKDINQFDAVDYARNLTRVRNVIFYVSDSWEHGDELWRTDGTEIGTYMVKDITPGQESTDFHNTEFVNVNGTLFFTANDGVSGKELWRSDGTEEGTFIVKDIGVGSFGSDIRELVNANGILYFNRGIDLWRSDGTNDGTWPLCHNYFSTTPTCGGAQELTNINGTLFFTARSNVLFTALEVWKSDGTVEGTTLVKDIYPGDCGSDFCTGGGSQYTELNGLAIFSSRNDTYGRSLWRSDGTEEGTILLKDIDPENNNVGSGGNLISELTKVDNTIYFIVDHSVLWKTDGTTSGTVPIREFGKYRIQNLTNINDQLWFSGNDGIHGHEPWISDGTLIGTYMIKDINQTPDWDPGETRSSYPSWFYPVGNTIFIKANSDELWISDGTEIGTYLSDPQIELHSDLYVPSSLGNSLYFYDSGKEGIRFGGLWSYDLNLGEARFVKNTNTSTGGIRIAQSISVNNKMYFTLRDNHDPLGDPFTFSFWQTNGTEEGTEIIEVRLYDTYNALLEDYSIDRFLIFKNKLLMLVESSHNEKHLYIYDDSTRQVEFLLDIKDISIYDDELAVIDDYIYFITVHSEYEWGEDNPRSALIRSVVKSDGTQEGTFSLFSFAVKWRETPDAPEQKPSGGCPLEIREWGFPNQYTDFTELNGSVYFNFCDYAHGYELWRTDGTPEGTAMVKDIAPNVTQPNGWEDVYSGDPRELTAAGGKLYFSAYTPDIGRELWVSDGTHEGTYLLKDIWPETYFDYSCFCERPNTSIPERLTAIGDTVYFDADNGAPDSDLSLLWKSDGTEEGTVNILPSGTVLTDIRYLQEFNGSLVFYGDDRNPQDDPYGINCLFGQELWVSDGTSEGTHPIRDISPGCLGTSVRAITPPLEPYKDKLDYYDYPITDNNILLKAETSDSYTGLELWRSDGTDSGTQMVIDLFPGEISSDIRFMYDLNGTLVFQANSGSFVGTELHAMKTYWTVDIDIKPDSIDNCVNFNEKGVIPVTVLGSVDVDVMDINPESLTLQGLELKMVGKSDKYLIDYSDGNGDGLIDLNAKFEDSDSFIEPGTSQAEVSGRLLDGTKIRGWDNICIVP